MASPISMGKLGGAKEQGLKIQNILISLQRAVWKLTRMNIDPRHTAGQTLDKINWTTCKWTTFGWNRPTNVVWLGAKFPCWFTCECHDLECVRPGGNRRKKPNKLADWPFESVAYLQTHPNYKNKVNIPVGERFANYVFKGIGYCIGIVLWFPLELSNRLLIGHWLFWSVRKNEEEPTNELSV